MSIAHHPAWVWCSIYVWMAVFKICFCGYAGHMKKAIWYGFRRLHSPTHLGPRPNSCTISNIYLVVVYTTSFQCCVFTLCRIYITVAGDQMETFRETVQVGLGSTWMESPAHSSQLNCFVCSSQPQNIPRRTAKKVQATLRQISQKNYAKSFPVCNKDYKPKLMIHPVVIQNNNNISVSAVHCKSKFPIFNNIQI